MVEDCLVVLDNCVVDDGDVDSWVEATDVCSDATVEIGEVKGNEVGFEDEVDEAAIVVVGVTIVVEVVEEDVRVEEGSAGTKAATTSRFINGENRIPHGIAAFAIGSAVEEARDPQKDINE